MTFDAFIETAWNDHADRPQEVADRLAASLSLVDTPEHVAPFARIVTHVFGEHLGQWPQGIAVLRSLGRLPACAGSAPAAGAIARNVAALRHAADDPAALDGLSTEDRVSALAVAASAFTGRNGFGRAIATYDEALELARAGLPAGSPALRALAVGGNNLAAALEEKGDRDAGETRGMIKAAEAALQYWKLAGTWLEEERAFYRLARSRLQAGDAVAATASAQRCIAVCAENAAPAFEQFFGHAALALAQCAAGDAAGFDASRRRAFALFDEVPTDDQQWCRSDLALLGG